MQNVFADDRQSVREVPEVRNSAREIVTPSPTPSPTNVPSATPSPSPTPAPRSDSSFQAGVPSVKSIKRPSLTSPAQSFVGSVPSITSNTSTSAMLFGAASLAFSQISTTTPTAGTHADLGAHIKYCIVFPILNAVGGPIPQFDVPVCPPGSTTTPPTGAPLLTVVKTVINDDQGTATVNDFTLRVNDAIVVSSVARVFSPGSYVVSESTTTVAVGTTTMTYAQSFSGDCDSSGNVTLALGDVKTCTIVNDDPGPGGQGGDPGGGDPSGNGGDGDDDGGGNGNGHGNNRSSSGGRIAGASDNPYLGGADAVPGIPNTGSGDFDGTTGLLVFSFFATILGFVYLRISLKGHFLAQ